jgi:endonuclease G
MDGPIWKGAPKTIGSNRVAIPAAYWKVVVDPDTSESLAFIMKNEPTPKGDLSPYQVTIAEVEKEAGISLPLPKGVSRTKQGTLWSFDLTAFKKAKAKKCPKK